MSCSRKTISVVSSALLILAGIVPTAADTPARSPKNTRSGFAPRAAPPPVTLTPLQEQLFVPIAPCRAFDTSKTGSLAAGSSTAFLVSGTSGFDTQGGKSGGCGLPASASGVAITLTTSSSGGTGTLTGKPYNAPSQTATTSVAFNSSGSFAAQVSLGVGLNAIKLIVNKASTNVTGDITGYYVPQIQAYINMDGSIFSGTARVLSVDHPSAGIYNVTIDRDVYYCVAHVTTGDFVPFLSSVYGDTNNIVRVSIRSIDSAGNNTFADADFNLTVHC